jgi:hypothetical protein
MPHTDFSLERRVLLNEFREFAASSTSLTHLAVGEIDIDSHDPAAFPKVEPTPSSDG